MTCIVGFVGGGKVVIGGDSAGVSGLDIVSRKDPKVFKVGDFLIGCTSSFRMIQLLRFSLKPPQHHDDVDTFEFMCTGFVDAIRECFKQGGYAKIDCSVEIGGFFLVGYKGRLFTIESDFQVGESNDNYSAIGCGQSFALGALSVINSDLMPELKVGKALEVAAHHSAGVRAPFTILSI